MAKRTGRPTKYDPTYGPKLIEHLAKGYTMESFAGELRISKDTLYKWLQRHREFADAKKVGEPLQELFYVKLGQSLATGAMRRVKEERVARLPNGQPIRDAAGNPVIERVYDTGRGNAVSYIWLTKNILKWRDSRDINLGGPDGGPVQVRRSQTPEERAAEMAALQAQLAECGND